MHKVVIFTSSLTYSVRKGIAELVRQIPGVDWLVVQHIPHKSIVTLLRNQWRNLNRHGWRWIPYQANEVFSLLSSKRFANRATGVECYPGAQYDVERLFAEGALRREIVQDLHASSTLEQIRAFAPDLGVALAAPILKPELFSIPRLGTLNLHKGKVPDYRGMPPAFWEFWHDEKEVGCTVHRIAAGLDTGPILMQEALPRQAYSTVKGMQLTLDELGVDMTCRAVARLLRENCTWTEQLPGGKTFRKPTLKQEQILHSKLHAGKFVTPFREWTKKAILYAYVHLLRPGPRLLLALSGRQRILVILYHRVSDELRDSVTVGIEQFDRQMALLKARYPIVSIDDVIDGRLNGHSTRPAVAVTFDDGYRDNYDHAVPILLRHKIPCAFFVSTGMMGAERGFAHDREKLGRALPNMTWEQLKHMHELGFTIGSHTVSHLNCAAASEDELRRELLESRDALRDNLGLKRVIFAYPFGKKNNMTPRALEIVREMGFCACLSAYGGYNQAGGIDPFNILRTGIDYKFSDRAFLATVEGWYRG